VKERKGNDRREQSVDGESLASGSNVEPAPRRGFGVYRITDVYCDRQ
jgi:hypothetical protein